MKPIIDSNGTKRWYNNLLHRDNDKPAIIYPDSSQEWYINGKRHRDNDLPAVIHPDGIQIWHINGKCHRLYKPAMIFQDGSQYWYINGIDITNEVIEFIKEHDLPHWSEWTEVHQILFRIRF